MRPATHRVVRQRCEMLVQGCVHLFRVALEESAAAADEERVAGEHRSLVGARILDEVAYMCLRVAGRVQTSHIEATDRELGIVVDFGVEFVDATAVTADDLQRAIRSLVQLGGSACVVVVVVGDKRLGELRADFAHFAGYLKKCEITCNHNMCTYSLDVNRVDNRCFVAFLVHQQVPE